jgi:hypothetical protein
MNATTFTSLKAHLINSNAVRAGALAASIGLATLWAGPSQAADPFANFTGSWSGNGTITAQNGTRERIRCRGSVRPKDSVNNIALSLRCASDSYKFELASDISYDGGNISGSWNETTRQVYGQLSGRATNNSIQAQVASVGFNATLAMNARGNNQSVSIRAPGSEITEVSVSLARAGK